MRYSSAIAALLESEHLNDLGPGTPRQDRRGQLAALTPADITGSRPPVDQEMACCCLAGLWLYYDFLDESHTLSQAISSCEGSYWHGIMHRREPDPSNAKYWFRRVGPHPIFPQLQQTAAALAGQLLRAGGLSPRGEYLISQANWDPLAFIDLCTAARTGDSACFPLCQQIQQAEWDLLFEFCLRGANGE